MVLRALLTCLVLAPLAAPPVLAQESRKTEAQAELQRLVLRIQEGRDRRGIAFAQLVQKGPKAAVQVAKAIDVAKAGAAARLLQVLGEMGPDATEAIDVLEKKADAAEGETRRRLYDTLVGITPHMEVGVRPGLITAAQLALHQMMVAEEDEKRQKIIAESWFRAVQYTTRMRGGTPLTSASSVDELVSGLDWVRSYSFRHELAAVLLSYKGKEANKAVSAMLANMRKAPYRPITTTGTGGKNIRYTCGPHNNRRIAAALLRLKPKPEIALEAHAYLLQKGLVHEQWQAIDTIRQHQEGIIPAVEKALVGLATDKEADRELRQEAVTTMGMLKTVKESTLKTLRGLEASTDKGMAVRAKAALRQLKGRR